MAGNPFYEGIEDVRQATREARARDAQVAEIRRQIADVQRQAARVQRNYEAARSRNDPAWDRVLRASEILLQLRDLEAGLHRLGVVESLPYRASMALIPQLASQSHQLLLKDETARMVAGAYSSDAYAMAGVVLKHAGRLPSQRSKRTDAARSGKSTSADPSKGVAAEIFARSLAKPNMRSKEARSVVAAPTLKTKSSAAPTVTATLSSDAYDLEHDRFTKSALIQMRDHLKGRLCFIGHLYTPPECVFGSFTELTLVKRGELTELDATIRVAVDNPRAVQVYELIKAGHRHGMSVGVLVNDSEPGKEKGQTDITSVIGLEASVVGIPANQASGWTRRAD